MNNIPVKIAIMGTGMVGRAHAAKLAALGHAVMVGTGDPAATLAREEQDAMGNPPFAQWLKERPKVKLGTFAQAAEHGELVYDALSGQAAVKVLSACREALAGKVLVDIANPLDFSKGMPPTLSVCNTDSLGEQLQRALPESKVVKTFNTMNAYLQVDPEQLAGGDHAIFVCGNDAGAKERVTGILRAWYGWKNIVDLGDITAARGTEMLLPVWLRLWGALGTPMFNFKVVK
ncbi:MAG TPA: NADP oxidoreductase [Elusimicrobia bacterium]|nr:MAG: NADP oxidoreductase [Elusimicrobia bacterium GWF2_62_30]HBA59878.1 NADP oxidoreductase [Elusimicrobiota bacterium]